LSNKNNIDYDYTGRIMAFDVTGETVDTSGPAAKVMPTLLTGSAVMDLKTSQSVKTRRMRVKRDGDIWTIGGMTWDEVMKSGYKKVLADPDLNDIEIWEIENSSGGWFHPVHIHLVDFKILSRNGRPPFPYELGPKDVVYVGEGETVRLLMKFGPHRGRYMIHCHNLPHEDHDMMGQFSVGYNPNDPDPNDPIEAVKPHPIDEVVPAPGGQAEQIVPTIQETKTAEATAKPTAQPSQTSGSTTAKETAAPVTPQPAAKKDVVTITTARHRLRKDISFAGTSKTTGTTAAGTVVLYDVTPGRATARIGTASINALGNWSWKTKPGPSRLITAVRAESSRGGTATAVVRTR
jgi:spore coat protein A